MQEYNHALNAARRLAAAHDLMLANKPPPANLILAEDVTVYIRWLVFNQHVLKNVTAFVTVSGPTYSLHLVANPVFVLSVT